jgi:hypothetical protein
MKKRKHIKSEIFFVYKLNISKECFNLFKIS